MRYDLLTEGEANEKRDASNKQLMSRLLMLVWREEFNECLGRVLRRDS